VFQYLDMYVACKSLYRRMKHFAWLSKIAPVTDLTTGRNGNVRAVVLDKPGSVSWNLETDVGFTADAAWDMACDRQLRRAQRLVAGQAVQ